MGLGELGEEYPRVDVVSCCECVCVGRKGMEEYECLCADGSCVLYRNVVVDE